MARLTNEEIDNIIENVSNDELMVTNIIRVHKNDMLELMQELKELRAADSKPLDIKGQLRLVRDKCPDVWEIVTENACTFDHNLPYADCDCSDDVAICKECWDKALE